VRAAAGRDGIAAAANDRSISLDRRDRQTTIEEVPLNWNKWIRQTHRWVSIAFTAAVMVNIFAVWEKKETYWVGFSALVPLIVLMITGLYLFVLPYLAGRVRVQSDD